MSPYEHVVALAGGVGGARLVQGLSQVLAPGMLKIIVNIGDDFDYINLRICPDLDTVCYTLAGLENPDTGWGLAGDSWSTLAALRNLGAETWFHLGDRDMATHLERTRRLEDGQPLSQVTQALCKAWGVLQEVLPASDHHVPTIVITEEGELEFQEYFVHRQCKPGVRGFRFNNSLQARPAPGVLEAISLADFLVICPSNPWVSIDPILAIPGIRRAIEDRRMHSNLAVVAVSPIIGGQAVKGPAAKMCQEMGLIPSPLTIARHYGTLISAFVVDRKDVGLVSAIQALGLETLVTDTYMQGAEGRKRLAFEILTWLEIVS